MSENIFELTPSGSGAVWVLVPIIVLMLAFALFMVSVVYFSKNSSVHLADDELVIKGGLYGRTLPLSELNTEDARVVNLYRERDYKLKRRSNGIGLPGYNAGWFQLQNSQKVLAFVTDEKEVVYIPTENGYDLMFSVNEAEAFLGTLQGVEF